MSWQDNLVTEFQIKTGDGKTYRPKWIPTGRELPFNVASFEFPEIEGTLVYRGEAKGRIFKLNVVFDGVNHIENCADFETSARDKRQWEVTHPQYGKLFVHPTSLNFDDSNYGLTRVTGDLLETIQTQYPKGNVVPKDKIFNDCENCSDNMAFVYSQQKKKDYGALQRMKQNISNLYLKIEGNVTGATSVYRNYEQEAKSFLDSGEQFLALKSACSLMIEPSRSTDKLINRFGIAKGQFDSFQISVPLTNQEKLEYELLSGFAIVAQASALSLPQAGDLATKKEIIAYVQTITDCYNTYTNTLNGLQGQSSVLGQFVPNMQVQIDIFDLLNYTISEVLELSNNAVSERTFILEEDTAWIVLAHRLYGIDLEDSTLTKILQTNEVGINHFLMAEKGKRILYFV